MISCCLLYLVSLCYLTRFFRVCLPLDFQRFLTENSVIVYLVYDEYSVDFGLFYRFWRYDRLSCVYFCPFYSYFNPFWSSFMSIHTFLIFDFTVDCSHSFTYFVLFCLLLSHFSPLNVFFWSTLRLFLVQLLSIFSLPRLS